MRPLRCLVVVVLVLPLVSVACRERSPLSTPIGGAAGAAFVTETSHDGGASPGADAAAGASAAPVSAGTDGGSSVSAHDAAIGGCEGAACPHTVTAITVGASYINFGSGNIVIALTIATVKGVIVALIFMHLLHDKPVNAVIAVAGFIFLGIFLLFDFLDVDSRTNPQPINLHAPPAAAPAAAGAPAAEGAGAKKE